MWRSTRHMAWGNTIRWGRRPSKTCPVLRVTQLSHTLTHNWAKRGLSEAKHFKLALFLTDPLPVNSEPVCHSTLGIVGEFLDLTLKQGCRLIDCTLASHPDSGTAIEITTTTSPTWATWNRTKGSRGLLLGQCHIKTLHIITLPSIIKETVESPDLGAWTETP